MKIRCFLRLCRNLVCILCAVTILSGQAFALDMPTISNTLSPAVYETITISARADVIVWKYKSFSGVLHKRQYNETRGTWIGDWVRA